MNYGKQIGVFVYGGGVNLRSIVNYYKARGLIVVLRDKFATIHQK